MPSRSEVLRDRAIRGQKALGMTRGLESLHAPLALARGAMRVLAAVIEIATLAMLYAGKNLACGRAVALPFVRDEHAWHILQAFEPLSEELLRGIPIPAALDQNIQDVTILIDRPPEVTPLAIDREEHFVKMPCVTWPSARGDAIDSRALGHT